MMGIKCPPATHSYKPHGKVLYCAACGDIQALLLDEGELPVFTDVPGSLVRADHTSIAPDPEAEAREIEAQIQRIRKAAGLEEPAPEPTLDDGADEVLGRRASYADLEPDRPRVSVAEGFNTPVNDDDLPAPGV